MHLDTDTIVMLTGGVVAAIGGVFTVIKFIREPLNKRMDGIDELVERRRQSETKVFERLDKIDVKIERCLTSLEFLTQNMKRNPK